MNEIGMKDYRFARGELYTCTEMVASQGVPIMAVCECEPSAALAEEGGRVDVVDTYRGLLSRKQCFLYLYSTEWDVGDVLSLKAR